MERASSVLANALSRKGFKVMYLAIFRHPHFFELDHAIEFNEPEAGLNEKKLNFIYTINRIRKRVKNFNPDYVIVYNKLYAALTVLALVGTDIPIFISERSSPLYKWRFPLNVFMRVVFSLFHPSGVVAQTSIAAKFQRDYFSKNIPIQVIPNAVRSVNVYDKKRENWILAVGRLADPLKGFDRLVHAYSNIKNKHWKLFFAGPDDQAMNLKKLVADLSLTDRILFGGRIDNIDEIYSQSGIFVIPSRSEGYPNALAEAMVSGLPCISFDFVAGPRDMITHRVNGLLVTDGDIDGMTKAIDELIDNQDLRRVLSTNAIELQKRLEDWNIVDQWLNFMFSSTTKK